MVNEADDRVGALELVPLVGFLHVEKFLTPKP
jgi:hypothetical protein